MLVLLSLIFSYLNPIYSEALQALKSAGCCQQKKPRPRPGFVPVAEVFILLYLKEINNKHGRRFNYMCGISGLY